MRGPVLLLQHGLAGAFDYRLPPGTPPGTIVEAPLGPRRVPGVVWEAGVFPAAPVEDARLREARPLDLPPLDRPLRQLLAWVAEWYLAPPAAVLRMALPQAAFAAPPRPAPRYAVGTLPPSRNPRRRALLAALEAARNAPPAPLSEWAARLGASRAALLALAKAGALVEAADEATPPPAPGRPPILSPAQQKAARALSEATAAGGFQPFLLDGVTGAGKTEVYSEAIAEAIGPDGHHGQALVLLPEIGLTQAVLARFCARFGFVPTLWHSSLKPSERRAAWHAIASGRAPVVVGARSALFLPMPRLRLIVVDEAHDGAFKQEDSVPYHGRDSAVMRARFTGIPVILATATPSVETLEQVRRGTYRALHLPDRHGGARLPTVQLVDLTRDRPPRGRWISPTLDAALSRCLAAGEQALLFLNRRGYAPLTLCRACGERIQCPDCTAWLVEHRLAGRLQCHHCGFSMPTPAACPACGEADSLVACGPGVERLAEEVAARYPGHQPRLVTSDTIRTADDMAALARDMREGRARILIGTQLMAKGHDFPGLTLVGVIDADLGLAGGDPRAAERVFQQIRQVAGRAGRGARPGLVLLQTHQPRARVMQALASGDAATFHAVERDERLAAAMPPFGRLAALIVSALDAGQASQAAAALARAAPRVAGITVHGPAPAPLAMLRGRHRHRLLVHARRAQPGPPPLQAYLREWLGSVRLPGTVRIAVDIDPQSFL